MLTNDEIFFEHVLDVKTEYDTLGRATKAVIIVDWKDKEPQHILKVFNELLLAEPRADIQVDGNIITYTPKEGGRNFNWLANCAEITFKQLLQKKPLTPQTATSFMITDLFSNIENYEDIKDIFRRALLAKKPVHILLWGPPATAKTLFLLEIARLPKSIYILGGSASKAGITTYMIGRPDTKFLIIDELDKMGDVDYSSLLSLMETGIVAELKYRRTSSVTAETWVFASANSMTPLPTELKSRFMDYYISEYDLPTFIRVSIRTLMTREETDEPTATKIAHLVASGSRDIRDCIKIARMAKTPIEAEQVYNTWRKYKRR